ncbi:unnamed protein product [Phytomonas sp. Hart1]|nr:unnamed protein product [Phytomonas sp. Hart1]|eukprot:CCW70611.1 unnamed protein product [Phytomonas sp. isolate Hart1]
MVNAYWEALLELCLKVTNILYDIVNPFSYNQHLVSTFSHSGVAMAVNILGERHDAEGNVFLLVSFRGRDEPAKSTFEAFDSTYEETLQFSPPIWVPLDDIRHFAEIKRYLKQMEESFPHYCADSNSYADAGMSLMENSDSGVKGLDEEERNALEQELRRLPKRHNSGPFENGSGAFAMTPQHRKELPPMLDETPEKTDKRAWRGSPVHTSPFFSPKRQDVRRLLTPLDLARGGEFPPAPGTLSNSLLVRKIAAGLPLNGANTFPARLGEPCEKKLGDTHPHPQTSHTQSLGAPSQRLTAAPPCQRIGGSQASFFPKLSNGLDSNNNSNKGMNCLQPPPRGIEERLERKNYRLSDSQRLQYEKFLHHSALSALKNKEKITLVLGMEQEMKTSH